MQTLFHTPGQKVTVFLEVFVSDGYRIDADETPIAETLYYPTFAESDLFPVPMEKVKDGLYTISFSLPKGAEAIGSYWLDMSYILSGETKVSSVQIVCTAPYGNFSVNT